MDKINWQKIISDIVRNEQKQRGEVNRRNDLKKKKLSFTCSDGCCLSASGCFGDYISNNGAARTLLQTLRGFQNFFKSLWQNC